jgi:hypothetical protein
MSENIANFDKYSGEIMHLAIDTDNQLGVFISLYSSHYKKRNLNFERKINLFEEICIEKGIVQKEIDSVVNAAHEIRILRNKIAHWPTMVNRQTHEVVLHKEIYDNYQPGEIKLTYATVKKTEMNGLIVSNGIATILKILQKV